MDDYDSDDSYDSDMVQSDFDEKLIESAINEYYYGVQKYLEKGANPNTTDYHGITPLNYAAMSDSESINMLRILLEYGAQINLKENTEFGNTALMNAAIYNYDNVKYLLERGANPFIENLIGNTAYDNAIKSGNIRSAKLLKHFMDHIDIEPADELSDPDINLMKDEAARHIQTIMRARFDVDNKRKLTKRRYGTWASPKTDVEKDRRYMDLIRQFNEEDPIRGYERYSIYPERLLPPKKGGKRNRKYYTRKRY